ncbi:MAG: glycosyltransferase, partial [Promethearchaeota archaeon]
MENTKLNIIFIGSFTFPYGMGGTELVKRFVDYCIDHNCKVKVFTILQRLKKRDKNRYKGMYNNQVPYLNLGIITGFRIFDILQYPFIMFYSLLLLLRWKERDIKNKLYVYDNINLFTILPVLFAKSIGYKVILEIVEDHALNEESRSSLRKLNIKTSIFLEKKIELFADSIIVVSKYLENKFRVLCGEKIPVHLIPVSTNMNNNFAYRKEKKVFSFLYAGSFAKKDGLETLVKAFNIFNSKYSASKLNLIGETNHHSHVQELLINDNINYLGYVEDYFNNLFESDVLCMTRSNSKFANAGF